MKIEITDLMLERYNLGELPPSQMKEIDSIVLSDPAVRRRLEEIKVSDSEIISEYPVPYFSGRIRDGLIHDRKKENRSSENPGRKKLFGISFSVLGTMSAAAAVFFFIPFKTQIHDEVPAGKTEVKTESSDDVIRFKGKESVLYLYRKTNGEPEELLPESSAKKDDVLQIGFRTKYKYAVIFSIDGRGSLTLHYPVNDVKPAVIESGKKVLLGSSYKLDDAPEFERFFIITSESSLKPDLVLTNARNYFHKNGLSMIASFSMPETHVDSIVVKKE